MDFRLSSVGSSVCEFKQNKVKISSRDKLIDSLVLHEKGEAEGLTSDEPAREEDALPRSTQTTWMELKSRGLFHFAVERS
jgi:hypothetical protein